MQASPVSAPVAAPSTLRKRLGPEACSSLEAALKAVRSSTTWARHCEKINIADIDHSSTIEYDRVHPAVIYASIGARVAGGCSSTHQASVCAMVAGLDGAEGGVSA